MDTFFIHNFQISFAFSCSSNHTLQCGMKLSNMDMSPDVIRLSFMFRTELFGLLCLLLEFMYDGLAFELLGPVGLNIAKFLVISYSLITYRESFRIFPTLLL